MRPQRHRPVPGAETEILAGPHVVLEALRAGRRGFHRIWLARQEPGGIFAIIRRLAEEQAISTEVRPRADLDRLIGGASHQGVLAEVGPFPYVEADTIVWQALRAAEKAFVVALDGIQDPQNLGAIVRTVEASGAHGLILPRDRAAGITPAAARASAGATEHLRVGRVTNLSVFLDRVKPQGVWVVGADASGDRLLYEVDLREPLVLVIGAEGHGLRPLVKSRCDVLVRIPLSGKVTSLNASCAAAVSVFEVIRQRQMISGSVEQKASDRVSG